MKLCKICSREIENKRRTVTCSDECNAKSIANKMYKYYRKGLGNSKKLLLRFEIFKRDFFSCIYCGRKPPECILEVDHKYPKGKGGKDEKENYITACRECNMGKGDKLLNNFRNFI